ncbi:uncharacterized protein [Euphorbia lathyris]|uniref:uncharacterized protein isoform X3 n=1 Tax=Euphorbia lathyris TaxID=212925 RepID=UPI003313FD83
MEYADRLLRKGYVKIQLLGIIKAASEGKGHGRQLFKKMEPGKEWMSCLNDRFGEKYQAVHSPSVASPPTNMDHHT